MAKLINQKELDEWRDKQGPKIKAIHGIDLAYRLGHIDAETAMKEVNRIAWEGRPYPHFEIDRDELNKVGIGTTRKDQPNDR